MPGLVLDAFGNARPSLLLVALDLLVRPPALSARISIFACTLLALVALWTGDWGTLMLLLGAWLKFENDVVLMASVVGLVRVLEMRKVWQLAKIVTL